MQYGFKKNILDALKLIGHDRHLHSEVKYELKCSHIFESATQDSEHKTNG